MQSKKTYIVILGFIIIFGVVMFLALGVDNIKKNKQGTTLIIGNNTVWTYNKQRWKNISSKGQFQQFNWQEFTVFDNNEKLGNYNLWYDDKWYLFDKKKNAINYEGDLVAYQANYNIDILKFEEQEIIDTKYVDYVLEENGLDIDSQFTSNYKVSVDFDNDGQEEELYLISNAFAIDFNPDKIFSIVFMIKDDYVYYLYNDISTNNSLNGCKPFLKTILDADNDGIYEFVISCAQYSTSTETDMLYKYVDDNFKIVISN